MSRYSRVLLKLSGESLCEKAGHGIDPKALGRIAREIKLAHDKGVQIGIVVGGGNIWRGASNHDAVIGRVTADYMGMLATVMNAMALQEALEHQGVPTRVQTAIEIAKLAEPYIRRRAIRHLEKGRIVIFAGGTGNPYFTTDTAAALRAIEIRAQLVLKATKVDGIYDHDPATDKHAARYDRLDYDRILRDRLAVMDDTAIVLCRDNRIPLRVFDFQVPHALAAIARGDGDIGTFVDFQEERT